MYIIETKRLKNNGDFSHLRMTDPKESELLSIWEDAISTQDFTDVLPHHRLAATLNINWEEIDD